MGFTNILWVGIGGALGSIIRYLVQKHLTQAYPLSFPLSTFIVNVSGCFLIGLFFGLADKHQYFTPAVRLLMMTGFCGGFTTFSAFTLEGMQLLNEQRFLIFTLYFVLSVFFGLIATFAGFRLTH